MLKILAILLFGIIAVSLIVPAIATAACCQCDWTADQIFGHWETVRQKVYVTNTWWYTVDGCDENGWYIWEEERIWVLN